MDIVFNRTIHALFPDPALGLPQIIRPAEDDEEDEEEEEETASEGGAPPGYELVGGFLVPKEPSKKTEPVKKAKPVKDKKQEPPPDELTEILTKRQALRRSAVAARARDELSPWRFGYINYFKDPALSWKWSLWKVPLLVIVTPSTSKDRLYDLRFWKIVFANPTTDEMLGLLANPNEWKKLPIWESSLAPGGSK